MQAERLAAPRELGQVREGLPFALVGQPSQQLAHLGGGRGIGGQLTDRAGGRRQVHRRVAVGGFHQLGDRLTAGQPQVGVELVPLERAEHDDADGPHHDQEHGDDRHQPGQQPPAQRHAATAVREQAPGRG